MGDVVTLVEKAEAAIAEDEAAEMTRRMMTAKFDLNDFMKQYKMVTGMGSIASVVKMIPGMGNINDKQLARVEKQYTRYEAMLASMTAAERAAPELLAKGASRRRRVARGSGHQEADVAELVAVFTGMRAQMQSLSRMMALGGGGAAAGMPAMSDEEMMAAVLGGTGPRKVEAGKVRRKKRALVARRAAAAGGGGGGEGGGGEGEGAGGAAPAEAATSVAA
jgi:signal recognition particle subunit SRP54